MRKNKFFIFLFLINLTFGFSIYAAYSEARFLNIGDQKSGEQEIEEDKGIEEERLTLVNTKLELFQSENILDEISRMHEPDKPRTQVVASFFSLVMTDGLFSCDERYAIRYRISETKEENFDRSKRLPQSRLSGQDYCDLLEVSSVKTILTFIKTYFFELEIKNLAKRLLIKEQENAYQRRQERRSSESASPSLVPSSPPQNLFLPERSASTTSESEELQSPSPSSETDSPFFHAASLPVAASPLSPRAIPQGQQSPVFPRRGFSRAGSSFSSSFALSERRSSSQSHQPSSSPLPIPERRSPSQSNFQSLVRSAVEKNKSKQRSDKMQRLCSKFEQGDKS